MRTILPGGLVPTASPLRQPSNARAGFVGAEGFAVYLVPFSCRSSMRQDMTREVMLVFD